MIENTIKDKIYQLKLLLNNTKNPFSLLLYYIGIKKEVICDLKYTDKSFKLYEEEKELLGRNLFYYNEIIIHNLEDKKEPYLNFINSLNEDILNVDGINFKNNEYNPILWEYFMDNPFIDGDFKDRYVIDVGANIGDTALVYANKGAEVIAFEPVPETCELAKENLKLNPKLKNQIKFFNYAIDGEDGEIDIYVENEANSASANSFIENGTKITVKSYSINTILKKCNFKPDIIKIDCEGAEYSIIEKNDLSMFNKIMVEYHESFTGISHKVLVKQLENMGFNVTIKEMPPNKLNEFGILIASKK